MQYADKNRPQKEYIRRIWLSGVSKPVRRFLTLPSSKALCIQDALNLGAINEKTQIEGVECDNSVNPAVPTNLNFSLTRGKLERTSFDKPFDLCFLDFCGQINAEILMWLKYLPLTDNAQVAFTFHALQRGPQNTFYKWAKNIKMAGPQYTTGLHIEDERLERVCALIHSVRPELKCNISYVYKDTSQMMFLGMYKGKNQRLLTRPQPPTPCCSIDKAETRLKQHLAGGRLLEAQRIGGFKIMWNGLTPGHKSQLKKKYKGVLNELGI